MLKTIKIIDLLILIANKEYDKLPRKIEYQGTEYIFDNNDYKLFDGANVLSDDCLTRYVNCYMLNDEVEIINEK